MFRAIIVLFALSLAPTLLAAQSLTEVARKERERREKNKERGVQVQSFHEDQIFEDEQEDDDTDDGAAVDGGDVDAASEEPGDAGPSRPRVPDSIELNLGADASPPMGAQSGSDYEEESRQRQRQEAEWRSRLAATNERIRVAEEQRALLENLHLVEGGYYEDENGNRVIESLDHLRRMVAEARQEVQAARKALEDLLQEARRSNVPPGWLR